MNWKLKAFIQNTIAMLPSALSYRLYYLVQRRFGGLRSPDPSSRLQAAAEILARIEQQGHAADSMAFLEIGTGPRVIVPIALWLCGASEIISVDLNPYLRTELVARDIAYIRHHRQEIQTLFQPYASAALFRERLARLEMVEGMRLDDLLDMMHIRYQAPQDAAHLDLPAHSLDHHISFTVLEHIPPGALRSILLEGRRVLKRDGLFVHTVDLSDHFAHSDESISAVNFLQFSEEEWARHAGNRYMYHNRLRIDDYVDLFEAAGLEILWLGSRTDSRALKELRDGFVVDQRFKAKSAETNATTYMQVVASSSTNTRRNPLSSSAASKGAHVPCRGL